MLQVIRIIIKKILQVETHIDMTALIASQVLSLSFGIIGKIRLPFFSLRTESLDVFLWVSGSKTICHASVTVLDHISTILTQKQQ